MMFRLSVSAIAFYQTWLLKLTAQHNKSLHLTARRLPLINVCWCFPRCVLLAVGR